MKNDRRKVITISAVIGIVLLCCSAYIALLVYPDGNASKPYVQPVGALHLDSIDKYTNAIVAYEENKRTPGAACQANMLGYDDRYVYARLACHIYENIHTPQAVWTGSGYLFEGRFTYKPDPFTVTNVEYIGDGNVNPSKQEIFPKQIADKAKNDTLNNWGSEDSLLKRAKQTK